MIWLVSIMQTLLFVIGAPLLTGVIKWVKCQLQNRKAPPIWQPYLNLYKLFHKEVLLATTTSHLFRLVPFVIFSITIVISAIVPLFILGAATNSIADVIVMIGLFALIRFLLALAGMDTGTAFGGMGSSREMFISSIAEPAILMVFFAVAMTAASTNLSNIIAHLTLYDLHLSPSLILAASGFALVALAETGRIPIDNPSTHLELTMIHEAMVLEYSGRYLALLEWSSQIKLMLYATLFINIFFPWGITSHFAWFNMGWSILAFAFKMIILVIILGFTEINLAKLRLFRVPYLLNLAFVFGLLAVLIHIIIEVG
ncbi:MAG TPA: formate hydrogenlyase [Coxiellaceae bacterium]|nr:MAG: formate hydrogenlyase [Gammaproteobacteria bacterium RBG_16_37_9]HBC72164.1 formate hydrogenlyase [Coxiellaceae bacterium]HBS52050.1 formate hydrogenlyase [Coxiellaceae bacterium]HBY56209.1 formate hydrogenlyase [Coxiellaceae bacterium]